MSAGRQATGALQTGNVELRHLRYFVAVAEELHFGRAAERLHMAQSPLSQQIRQLEREVGVALFVRTTRRVELTPAGAALLRYARASLREAATGIDVARRTAAGELGLLRIGFVDSAAYQLLPRLLPAFHAAHPRIGVQLRELTTVEQRARLGGEIDVGIVRDATSDDDAVVLPLVTERLVAAVAAGHRLAGRTRITLAELADESFIVFPDDRVPDNVGRLVRLCRSSGFTPRVGQRALQHATVLGLVESRYGVALLPASVRESARPGVAMLDLEEPQAVTQLAILHPRASADGTPGADPLVAAFADVAREVFGPQPEPDVPGGVVDGPVGSAGEGSARDGAVDPSPGAASDAGVPEG